MFKMACTIVVVLLLALSFATAPAAAQVPRPSASWAATLANDVRVVSNVTYLTANN